HRGVGDRDAFQSFGGVNQQRLTHHHAQGSGTGGNALGGGRGRCGGRVVLIRRVRILGIVVLRGWRSRCTAVESDRAREHRGRTKEENGGDERKRFNQFGPLRGYTSIYI